MFGSLGGPELVLILVIALIVFGPRRLPDIGKSVGKMLVEFRRASNDFKRTIEEEVEAERHTPAAAGPVTPAVGPNFAAGPASVTQITPEPPPVPPGQAPRAEDPAGPPENAAGSDAAQPAAGPVARGSADSAPAEPA